MSYLPRTFNVSIAANQEQFLDVQGSFFYCIQCSEAEFEIAADNAPLGFFAPGTGYRIPAGAQKFKQLRIKNNTANTMTVELIAGDGEFLDNRLNIIQDTINSSEVIPNTLITVSDVAVATGIVTLILAANVNRAEVIINNPSLDYNIRIGDSNINTSRGILVPPASSLVLPNSAAIYCYQASGSAISIPVSYTERS